MLRQKGNVYKIDTPKTTLIFGMDAAMLYYGKRLTVPVPDYDFLRGNGKKRNEDKRPSFEFAPEVVCAQALRTSRFRLCLPPIPIRTRKMPLRRSALNLRTRRSN